MSVLLNRNLPPSLSWKQFLSQESKAQLEAFDTGDSRKHRKLFLTPGMVRSSRGSCYLECGNTKVLAAVYGPRENLRSDGSAAVMEGRLSCQFSIAPFSSAVTDSEKDDRDLQKLCNDYEKAVEECMLSVVDVASFAKSTVDVSVLVLEHDGGILAHSLTAVSCALTNAGIHMHDLVIGVNAAIITQKEDDFKVIIDPRFVEECISYDCSENKDSPIKNVKVLSTVTVGFLPNVSQIACLSHSGQCPNHSLLSTAVKSCIDTCPLVYAAVQTFLKRALLNETANDV